MHTAVFARMLTAHIIWLHFVDDTWLLECVRAVLIIYSRLCFILSRLHFSVLLLSPIINKILFGGKLFFLVSLTITYRKTCVIHCQKSFQIISIKNIAISFFIYRSQRKFSCANYLIRVHSRVLDWKVALKNQNMAHADQWNRGIFLALRSLMHIIAAVHFWYGIWYDFANVYPPKDHVAYSAVSGFGGKLRYLTVLGAVKHLDNSLFCVYCAYF